MNDVATTPREVVIAMSGVTSGSLRDPDAEVVREVNWSVASGDFWVVAGLQGTGKSDFMMMAAGLLPPSSGTLLLFGGESQSFEETRLKLGLVFDGGHLFHTLPIAENVSLPLRYHCGMTPEEISERTDRLLELTGLTPWADSTPGTLGRNWQKRAGLARALAVQPELLLVDNPISDADPRHAEWWLKFLGELSHGHDWMPKKRPTTLVITADDARPWRGIARQFAVLRDGRLEVEGDS